MQKVGDFAIPTKSTILSNNKGTCRKLWTPINDPGWSNAALEVERKVLQFHTPNTGFYQFPSISQLKGKDGDMR